MLRKFVFAAAAPALLALAPHGASAQSASFCGGKLAGDSFYSTVTSNGAKSRVDYFLQLRNTTSAEVTYMVMFRATASGMTSQLNESKPVAKYQSVRLKLASQMMNNPSGAGGLSVADVKAATMVNCR